MTDIFLLWLQFFVGSVLIILAGVKLTKYADFFSDKLNIGKAFIGMVFLGWVTSLPEMVMSVTSVLQPVPSPEVFEILGAAANPANLAIGNITGSIFFNVFALAFMELMLRKGPVHNKINAGELLSPLIAIILSLILLMALVVGSAGISGSLGTSALVGFLNNPGGMNISFFTFLIFAVYIISTYFLYRHDRKSVLKNYSDERSGGIDGACSMGMTVLKALIISLVIVAAGIWVAKTADTIAEVHAISKGFVGTVFLALVSSLPEFTTTIAAGRMGHFSMAVGNIFGSNIFNVMILGLADIFYREGPLFALVNMETAKHEVMTCFGIMISIFFLIGFIYSSNRSPLKSSWTAILISALYIIGIITYYFI